MRKTLSVKLLLTITLLSLVMAPFAEADIGTVLYERWTGDGTADSMLTEASTPDHTEPLTSTEWGVGDDNAVNNYRARITGWLIPPADGNYIFWIVTDDNGRLWLSTDSSPANAQLIASESTWAGEDGWGAPGDEAQSSPIPLLAGQPYWFCGGYQEGNGGDHIRIAWASTEAAIADHTIIQTQYLADSNPAVRAYAPNPAHGEKNVILDVQLQWNSAKAIDPANPNQMITDPNLIRHDVFISNGDPTDPNVTFLDSVPAGDPISDHAQLDPLEPGTLQMGKTYYWRVDEVTDANTITGYLWMFETLPLHPVIDSQTPSDQFVHTDEDAIFTVSAKNPYDYPNTDGLSYKWYKVGDPTVRSTDPTLIVSADEPSREGQYYCTVTIDGHPEPEAAADSRMANLQIKKLIGHWPFDDNLDDIVAANDGSRKGKANYATGIVPLPGTEQPGTALNFEPKGQEAQLPTDAHDTLSWSLSFWEKADPIVLGDEYEVMMESGSPSGWEILDLGRYNLTRYYLAIHEVYEFTAPEDPIARGQWNMFTATYDAKTRRACIYVNDQLVTEYKTNFTGFDTVFYIGNAPGGGYPYYGAIDDLKFYNYALEPIEIVNLYATVTGERVCMPRPAADISGPEGEPDCIVDIYDLAELAASWLDCNRKPAERCL